MSCILKLKQNYERFTKTEKIVADYISQHSKNIPSMSVKELADNSNSSTGAVIRLMKKLDYKNFSMLKIDIVKNDVPIENVADFIINDDDCPNIIAKKVGNLILESLTEIENTMNFEKLEMIAKKLSQAETIYLLGVGSSGVVAMDLYQKLIRLNKKAVFNQDTHMQILTSVFAKKNDVVIAFSYSGETKEVNMSVKNAKENGAYIIGITKSCQTRLVSLCDFHCFLPNNEGEFRLGAIKSRYSQLFISDLLYLSLAQVNFNKTKEYIVETRNAIQKFKKQ